MRNSLSRRAACAALAMLAQLPGAGALAQADPKAPIMALDDALLAAMKAGGSAPFAQRAAALAPVIQRTFALDAILAASVGPRFASFPQSDRTQLLAVFTDYTVARYVANFDSFSGERFEVSPQTRAAGGGQVVSTQIVPASGAPTRLDYLMRAGASGWQVADVLAEGSISQVAVQRSDFRSLVQGGSAAPLIDALRTRVTRLASGAKS